MPDTETDTTDTNTDDTSADGGAPAPKTLTQDEVNRLVAREKAAAVRAAKKEYDDYLAAQKADADKATMDEATRAKTEAAEAKAEAERIKAEAKAIRVEAKAEAALARAGVDAKALGRAVGLLKLDADADDDAISAEIDALKADVPGLFVVPGTPAPSGVTTGGAPGGGAPPQKGMEAGRELARKEREKQQERTPFNTMHVVGKTA